MFVTNVHTEKVSSVKMLDRHTCTDLALRHKHRKKQRNKEVKELTCRRKNGHLTLCYLFLPVLMSKGKVCTCVSV